MKRSKVNNSKEEQAYKMDLSEVYKVKFNKDFGAFKSGDETHVSLPIAMKWVKAGYVSSTKEIKDAVDAAKCSHLIGKDENKKEPEKEPIK